MKDVLSAQLNQLQAHLSALNNHVLIKSYRRWNVNYFIFPPATRDNSTFENLYANRASQADRVATQEIAQIQQQISLVDLENEHGKQHVSELYDRLFAKLNDEMNTLRQSFFKKVLTNPPVLDTPEKIKRFLADLTRGDYALRLNLSLLHSISNVLVSSLQELLETATNEDGDSTLNTINDYLLKLQPIIAEVNEVIADYPQAKASIVERVTEAKNDLWRTNLAQALQSIKVKADALDLEAQANPDDLLTKDKAQKAADLFSALDSAHNDLLDSSKRMPWSQFEMLCKSAIAIAKPTLITHRGWAEEFGNWAFYLTTGFTLGAAMLVSWAITGDTRFFKIKTESAKIVETFETELQKFNV